MDILSEPKEKSIDYRIKNITPRTEWGARQLPESIFRVNDNEFLMVIGARIVFIDTLSEKNVPSKYLFPIYNGCTHIVAVAISSKSKYLAVSIRTSDRPTGATLLIYDIEANLKCYTGSPKVIQYDEPNPMNVPVIFSAVSFSLDLVYVAAIPTPSSKAVLIYDWARDRIIQQVPIKGDGCHVRQVSFNPMDSARICMIGDSDLFQFWRYTTKTVHAAPIIGLPSSKNGNDINYLTSCWLADDKIVVGTECGKLVVVLNCQVQVVLTPFAVTQPLDLAHIASVPPSPITSAKPSRQNSRKGSPTNVSGRSSPLKKNISISGIDRDPDVQHVSDSEEDDEEDEAYDNQIQDSIVSIITHGDVIAIATSSGRVAAFMTKFTSAAGGHGAAANLILLATYTLRYNNPLTSSAAYSLFCIEWNVKAISNFDIVALSSTCMSVYDLKSAAEAKNFVDSLAIPGMTAMLNEGANVELSRSNSVASANTIASGSTHHHSKSRAPTASYKMLINQVLAAKKQVMQYHCGKVHSLCLSSRTTLFATACMEDETVRLWDFNDPVGPAGILIENYGEKLDELPASLDLHPSGRFIAYGCENEVREYAITENKFDTMRRIPTKIAVTTPSGEPFMNNQPVSLLRYSHGGHLLAVVTGRMIQVFQLYKLEYHVEKTGTYARLMALTDHSSNITDLIFSDDDELMYTSSVDGSVYEWVVNASTQSRNGDYIWKGASATKVVSCSRLMPEHSSDKRKPPVSSPGGTGSVTPVRPGASKQTSGEFAEVSDTTGNEDGHGMSNTHGRATKMVKKTTVIAVYEYDQAAVKKSQAQNRIRRQSTLNSVVNSFASGRLSNSVGLKKNESQPKLVSITRQARSMFGGNRGSSSDVTRGKTSMLKAPSINGLGSLRENSLSGRGAGDSDLYGIASSGLPSCRTPKPAGCYLALWDDHISAHVQLLEVECKVTAIAMGKLYRGSGVNEPLDICTMGLVDGRVLISAFPFKTKDLSVSSWSNVISSMPSRLAEETSAINSTEVTKSNSACSDEFDEKILSLPTNSNSVSPTRPSSGTPQKSLDISSCKACILHSSRVTQVTISQSGLWIFSTCDDGSIYMCATSNQAGILHMNSTMDKGVSNGNDILLDVDRKKGTMSHSFIFENVPEANTVENTLTLTDRDLLLSQNSRIDDLLVNIEDARSANARNLNQLTEKKDLIIADLEGTLKREIARRDEIIMNGRDEHARHAKKLRDEIAEIKVKSEKNTSALEVMYEKKLAREQLQYQDLKQYLDEYACNARLDIEAAKNKVTDRELNLLTAQNEATLESEKQKAQMLLYVDYVKERYSEVIASLEKAQEIERQSLKREITQKSELVDDAVSKGRSEMTTLRRNVQLLTKQLNDKDMALLSVQSDLEWARERISRLDAALQQASSELKLRMDTAERWEFKAGDQQQQISELERIRKALTSQLHSLRQELVPKEEQIIHMNEQLQELDREYETSLGAVSEKELILKQNSTKLHVLQKQVSELRYALSRKDGALHRAAKIFDEYRHSVQRARFDSIKQPIKHGKTASAIDNLVLKSVSNGSKGLVEDEPQEPTESDAAAAAAQIIGNSTGTNSQKNSKEKKKTGKNEVEMMVITEPVERAWKRLGEILKPYINSGKNGAANEDSAAYLSELENLELEKQTQMALMQRSVAGLRANIELTNVVTANKVNAHMKDNKQLLNEVNVLRHEMRSAMLENSQLKSKIDFYESRAKSREARERNSEAMRHMEHEAGVVSMGSYDEPDRNQLHEYSGLYSHSHIQREASRDGQVENVSADMLPLTAPNISLYTNPSEPGLEFNSPNMPPIIIGADIDDDGSFQSTRAPSAEYDSDLKLDPTVSHISHASLDTNESVSEKVKNISVKISENSHANNNNKNVKSENLGSSIENKLDLIMSENSLEIKKQSAAHDILNKYTSKLESENSVRMAEVANTVAESHEKERSKKSKLKKNRDSAIKSVTLNSKVKFPSLVDLSTKTANHSHVPPGYSNALAIANAASKSGSYINESKLSSSDYSASNALNSTGYLDVLNNLNSKRNNSNSKSTKKTSQSTSSLGSRPLGWKRNEM